MKLLCYDIGATNIKYGVIENEVILEKGLYPTDGSRGHQGIEDDLYNNAKMLIDKYTGIEGVGISSAGSIDYDNGKMLIPSPSKPEFGQMDFAEFFGKHFSLKVVADNDVNTFASCECFMGCGKEYSNFIMMTIGTGIGGGIVINRQILRGKDWNGGEIGRMYTGENNYEYYASVTGLLRQAKAAGINAEGAKDIYKLKDSGDETAIKVINNWYGEICKGIANLIFTFNPEAVVIGGGVTARPTFVSEVKEYLDNYLVDGFKGTCEVLCAKYQNDGGILGAYCNYVNRYGKENK